MEHTAHKTAALKKLRKLGRVCEGKRKAAAFRKWVITRFEAMRAERQYYFDNLTKVEVKYTYSKFSCQMREQGSSVISIMGNQDVLPINPKIAELLISPDKSRVRVEDFFKQQSLCRLFQKSNDFLLFYLPQMLPEMPAIK